MSPHLTVTRERIRTRDHTITPRPGDLLFGQRACSVQVLMNITGDQWTHVALVVEGEPDDAGPVTVELGPQGLFSRPVTEFVERYRLVGLARPRASAPCRRSLTTAAVVTRRMGRLDYSWAVCILTGSTSLARRLVPPALDERVARTGRRTLDRLRTRGAGELATCSSLIADLLQSTCDGCRPRTRWPARPATAPWQGRPTVTDVVSLDEGGTPTPDLGADAGRALLTPSDLWVADGYELRAVYDGATTIVLRHLDPTPGDGDGDDDGDDDFASASSAASCRRRRDRPSGNHQPVQRKEVSA